MSVRTQWLRDAWSFLATFVGRPGEFVVDTTNWRLVVHDGVTPGGHPAVSAGDLKGGVPALGVNTAADTTNRLAVKSEAALLSWDEVTPGAGNMRLTLNKKAAANDAGLVLQTGYASRVLFGTLGSDDLTVKTSPDGTAFRTAMTVSAATGYLGLSGVTEPGAPVHVQGLGARPAVQLDAYGGDAAGHHGPVANCRARAARGAPGAPLPLKATDTLLGLFAAGYHSGGAYTAEAVALLGVAEEDLTATAQGTCLDVQTTAPGTAARRSVVKVRGNGALELQPLSAEPAGGVQGQIYADSTLTALRWHDGASWSRITNFAKAAASTNFDNYVPADAWTKVQFNTTDSNDQGAFDAAKNRFVALEAGLHGFDVALTYKRNGSSAPTALEVQLYRNGAAAGRGRAAATGALVDGVSAVNLASVLKLAAKDTVEVFVRFTGADGYVAAADSFFGARQLP
ncbi:hypothetical protein SAMN02799625_01126 [Methylobacterium sp. UNC300MFChir4.1]|uniref:hyaluronate lyase N-terminal domain-containing protein n=1 Tax=Methylobacterium sp. UNC300MFChir4.1 TaxID=1502747 RepID=UPI0008BE119A|nr:hypothetical protein [Methylobacterium sp. UNC300MFChir4.1]SEN28842.1 hypothetical protein SAMN02799625_01126 [Methylobacterium sp. UNC300MFChir4.1]